MEVISGRLNLLKFILGISLFIIGIGIGILMKQANFYMTYGVALVAVGVLLGPFIFIDSLLEMKSKVILTEDSISMDNLSLKWDIAAGALEENISRYANFFGKEFLVKKVRHLKLWGAEPSECFHFSDEWLKPEDYEKIYNRVRQHVEIKEKNLAEG